MVDTVKAPGRSWSAPLPLGAEIIENFTINEIPSRVGVTGDVAVEAPSIPVAPVRNRRIAMPRRRRTPTHFIRASSPELERQMWKLIAGQIDEIQKPPPGTRRTIMATTWTAGERRFCAQLGDVLTKFGHEWCVCSAEVARMAEKMNSDIFISSAFWIKIPPPDPASGVISLLYIHSPGCVSPANYQHINTYENLLFAQSGTGELEECFRKNGKSFRQLETYLTLGKTNFCDSPKRRIAYVGYLHESRRRDEFAKLFELLDAAGYCEFYGPANQWQKKGLKSWKREMPFRGCRDVQDVMEPAGIALLLHSQQQFASGSPVYRDFEALSSSCVIITEKTAFMEENFGDCALFIDTDRPVEEIFEQIDTHVKWIHAHPEEAIEMARKSHQIFCDKFSLEGECEKILKFVDEISAASSRSESESEMPEREAVATFSVPEV